MSDNNDSGASIARIIAFGVVGVVAAGVAIYNFIQGDRQRNSPYGPAPSDRRHTSNIPSPRSEKKPMCGICSQSLVMTSITRMQPCECVVHEECLNGPVHRCPVCRMKVTHVN